MAEKWSQCYCIFVAHAGHLLCQKKRDVILALAILRWSFSKKKKILKWVRLGNPWMKFMCQKRRESKPAHMLLLYTLACFPA